jgi:hypothetical protein
MKLTEVEGIIDNVSFETYRGLWINTILVPCGNENTIGSEAQIPVDFEVLRSFKTLDNLHNRRIKVTVELIDG